MAQYPQGNPYAPGPPYQQGGYQPMPYQPDPYAEDKSHLNLLAIFYYVKGGLTLVGCLLPLIYVVIGVIMIFGGAAGGGGNGPNGEELVVVGIVIIAIAGLIVLLLGTLGVCQILTGRKLQTYQGRTFCLVVAGITCLNIPLGTVLGIFTFIVLGRPTVQQRFR